ncbi:MAG: flippase activity-associated protein Agl23 [Candidatus Aminicenantales bacterium]
MTSKAFAWLFLLVFLLGLFFRFYELGLRPMHHDEANQALKFALLLEQGQYRYDPTDHHGPSLYYLSWPLARLLGGKTIASQSEATIRSVPVFFGLGTMILFFLFLPSIGRSAILWSGLGLAISPAAVYFSRFYIQETLLVFFLTGFLGSLWRYVRRPSLGWALGVGFFAGMMYATKETSVIAYAAAATAIILTLLGEKKRKKDRASEPQEEMPPEKGQKSRARWRHLFLGFALWLLVLFLFFSSFLQNPKGVVDSFRSFRVYFVRAAETAFHIQPWFYYLKTLAFSKAKGGPIWTEAFLMLLALAGARAAFKKRAIGHPDPPCLQFIFFYTFLTTVAFSLIRYKTPWNLLPFHLGIILLAGAGAATILEASRKNVFRLLMPFLLAAGFFHLGWQSYRANFVLPVDPQNPYVYAQTSAGYLKLMQRVEAIASIHPEGKKLLIKVVAHPYETWPLPWSLRKFERVGYWAKAAEVSLADCPAVVIASLEEAAALEPSINTMYRPEYYELRPNVLLVLFVRSDIWDDYLLRRHPA